jgi:TRAP-type C4-dicarboxylate transport system permease small subunit
MKRFKHISARIFNFVTQFFLESSGALIVLMAFMVSYGVVKRYFFRSPDLYAYELTMIFLIFSVLLSIPQVEKLNRNILCDIISPRFPEGVQEIINKIIIPALGLYCCVIMTWKSWENVMFSLQISEVTHYSWAIPMFPLKLPVTIGFGLLTLVFINKFYYGIVFLKDSIIKAKR